MLSRRIDRILQLISVSLRLTEEERKTAKELWEYAKEFSKLRNRIAHNPVLPTWKPGSNADADPPDVLGIPDFKQFKEGIQSDSIPIELMDKMIDESGSLAQKLHDVFGRLRSEA